MHGKRCRSCASPPVREKQRVSAARRQTVSAEQKHDDDEDRGQGEGAYAILLIRGVRKSNLLIPKSISHCWTITAFTNCLMVSLLDCAQLLATWVSLACSSDERKMRAGKCKRNDSKFDARIGNQRKHGQGPLQFWQSQRVPKDIEPGQMPAIQSHGSLEDLRSCDKFCGGQGSMSLNLAIRS